MIHTDHLTTKLSTACCVIRSVNSLYSPFHTVLIYGIIFWGNSIDCTNFSDAVRVIRIIMGYGNGDFCRNLFKNSDFRLLCHNIYIGKFHPLTDHEGR